MKDMEKKGRILSLENTNSPDTPLSQIPRPLLEYLLETSPSGVVIIDQDSTLLYINPALAKIFGYEKGEMLGESLTMIMPKEMQSKHTHAVKRLKKTKTPSMDWEFVQLPGVHKSGDRLDSIEFRSV